MKANRGPLETVSRQQNLNVTQQLDQKVIKSSSLMRAWDRSKRSITSLLKYRHVVSPSSRPRWARESRTTHSKSDRLRLWQVSSSSPLNWNHWAKTNDFRNWSLANLVWISTKRGISSLHLSSKKASKRLRLISCGPWMTTSNLWMSRLHLRREEEWSNHDGMTNLK